ncbi:Rrf2 family transcriptional regulator [Novosphingobium barchaimii]|nr:Rrf2 family transcriptional regulator [Novosphingobium barchaimii]
MPRDNRLSRTLHVLIHLDRDLPKATSEKIADMLGTNPVVVRRMMAGLREAGHVKSEKGPGGGWSLTTDLSSLTLRDVYQAIGSPEFFSIGPSADDPDCLVEKAVDAKVMGTLRRAEAMMMAEFGEITIASIADDFQDRLAQLPEKFD